MFSGANLAAKLTENFNECLCLQYFFETDKPYSQPYQLFLDTLAMIVLLQLKNIMAVNVAQSSSTGHFSQSHLSK